MFEIYGTGEEPEFDYIEGSPKGPQHWGELKPEWAECKDGRSQSPIDILNKNVKIASKTGDLRLNYKASNAIVKNTGFSIEVRTYLISSATSIFMYTTYFTYFIFYTKFTIS